MRIAQRAGCRVAALTLCVLVVGACASSHISGNDDARPDDAAIVPDADTRLPYGQPCTDGGQCMSGFCYQTKPGDPGFCTKQCNFDCPRGYACETVDVNGFTNRLCIPAVDTFCQTCKTSDDCGDDYDNCVPLTDGKFCSKDCGQDPTVCPAGFTCQIVGGGSGDLSQHQCMPLNGTCCIDGDNDRHGVGADCLGLDCNDTDPAIFNGHPEICDGKDNDCNASVDDNPIDCKGPLCELGSLGYYSRTGDICNGVMCVQQPAMMCGLYTCSGGGEVGDDCALKCDVEDDTKCVPAAHCDASVCYPDVVDGTACDEDTDCQSGHCQNGFCCAHGDCCQQANQCPGFGSFSPTCDDPATCQGTRGEAVCNANSICSTNGMVQDDSACSATTVANDCGLYKPVFCNGGTTQTTPSCPTSCQTDAQCDDDAWCNPSNHQCQADLDDGDSCGKPGDDLSCKSGHCQNGFCCGAGDCCGVAQDCPSSYARAPACTSPSACDGDADVATCANHECATAFNVDDDSACTGSTVASTCGPYKSIFCTGSATQTSPVCPDSCTSDSDCDTNAYCNAAGHCVPDESDGGACAGNQQCVSAHCQNGFCCGAGDCCAADSDCNAYDKAPVCNTTATCQGTRVEGACSGAKECGTTTVDDDSGCGGIVASDCGPYPSTVCTNMQAQAPPTCATMCAGDQDCDISAHCNPQNGMCEPDQGQGGFCSRPQDCGSGLSCVDSVCCNTACNGSCEACDLAGHVGTCTKVPNGQDPGNECGGVSCAGFYYGWAGSSCDRKADVPANVASCDGAGACRTQATECGGYNVAGPVTQTCNGTCQTPTGGTCAGQTPGQCTNINPGTTTCGQGICTRTVNQCVNGAPNTCVPGTPQTETCNDLDDNCDGVVDNGAFSDTYEPNGDCPSERTLGAVGSQNGNDNSNTYSSMTVYGSGDYDYYALPLHETDNSCGCSFPSFDEDYKIRVLLTVPAGAGSYELCMNTDSYCNWPSGYCFQVAAGTTTELDQWLDGSCPGTDNYTTYLRIRGNSPPGFQCHPYTLSYIFESGYCRP